jgi:hypothetical protein
MKRTTIFVPEHLERDLQLYARRAGKPAASIVREAIAAYIATPSAPHALPSFTGAFASGHTDTAERHEELLFGTLSPHGDPRRPVKQPGARSRRPPSPRRRR